MVHLPRTQVNYGYIFRDVTNNLGAVEVEQGSLIVGLVELGDGYYLVPNEKTFVVIQQLVGDGRCLSRVGDGRQCVSQLVDIDISEGTAADIEDAAVLRGRCLGQGCFPLRRRQSLGLYA